VDSLLKTSGVFLNERHWLDLYVKIFSSAVSLLQMFAALTHSTSGGRECRMLRPLRRPVLMIK